MTQEEKDLLLRDLCARLPYGVKCRWESDGFSNKGELTDICHHEGVNGFKYWDGYLDNDGEDIPIEIIKPYLRPMSSMTEEEKEELSYYENPVQKTDFYYSHHIDCRFMIEKGLALEAPEGMYKTE